jgi:hypothetical protein
LVATWTQADAERTGIPAGTYIVDYKSSSDPKKWALSEAELQRDLAACIYRVAGRQLRDPTLLWLYAKSRGTPTVYPQRATLKYLPALARVREEIPLARRLEAILAGEVIPIKNPEACHDYGGCPYAATIGGPCDAKPSVRKMFATAINAGAKSEIKKGKKMAIKGLAQRAAAAAAEKETPADDGADDTGKGPDEVEAPAATTKKRKPRTPRPTAVKKGAPTGALADALEDAQVKLAEVKLAEAALEDAREALSTALAAVQNAGAA